MPATLDIQESSNELIFHVYEKTKVWRILVSFAGAAIFGYFLYKGHDAPLTRIIVGGFLVFVTAKDIISQLRGANVTLEVTNSYLISSGHAPDGYEPSSIPRASIYGLQFQEARNNDNHINPSGLHVDHEGIREGYEVCVLPHIDKEQTKRVIDAILNRFPDTESIAQPRPGHPSDLISLNLNK